MNKGITLVIALLFALQLFCACGGSDGDGDDEPIVVGVTSVDLSQTTLSMKVGEQMTLTARVSPTNATNKTVSWSSSQTSVATVSSNGQVTAVGKGSCVIKATAGGKNAQCTVTVTEKEDETVAVEAVTLSDTSLSLEVGKSSTLTATVSPSNATDKTVTWKSSDASVATVDNGVVKAVKVGTATISATAGGKSAQCTVTVNDVVVAVTSVTLSETSLSLEVGKSSTLTATVSPSNATDKTVIWESSDASVATVDNGVVKAVKVGTATISATAGGKSAQCTVTVNDVVVAVTSVTLSETSLSLEVGKSSTLTATVSPSNATDKTVIWESSDASVATVDNGVVKAVKAGAATITATAGGKSATCTVKVKQISGFGAYINSWDEDCEDYGGIVK